MLRVMIACVAMSAVLSGCSDSMASASGDAISKQAKCEEIIAHEHVNSGRSVSSDDLVGSMVSNDLVNACRQTAGPVVEHLHLRYGL